MWAKTFQVSDGEKKLSPAEIAYPSATGGDGFVDHYVGQRRRSEPEPVPHPEPPNGNPPVDEKPASRSPSSERNRFRWGFLLLASVLVVGYLANGRLGGGSAEEPGPNPSAKDVVLRIISDPPAHVYRRQLELGVTPLEVARDEGGAELRLSLEGYQATTLTFEGASPGVVKEVRVKLEPLPSDNPSALPSPAAKLTSPQASSLPRPRSTPTPSTQVTPTSMPTPAPETSPGSKKAVKATPRPKPVAAQPPPPPAPPVYHPPPRRAAPPPPPRESGGGSHRIKPPDF